jgi:hypothetical protein
MKHDLKEPCAECPYVGKMKGWVGEHDPQDFVDLVRADIPFACHMTVTQPGGPDIAPHKAQQCAGYAIFMTRMCKMSRRPEMTEMQIRLKKECDTQVLFPGDVLVDHHTL